MKILSLKPNFFLNNTKLHLLIFYTDNIQKVYQKMLVLKTLLIVILYLNKFYRMIQNLFPASYSLIKYYDDLGLYVLS